MKATRSLALAALMATGLFTAAAIPAPAQTALSACGQLTKGSYKLTKNLTATGHCLTLVNNFTSIDLNGFVITGDGGAGDYAIRKGGAAATLIGIEIRNGTITNFGRAIELSQAGGVLVERVRAVRNGVSGITVGAYCVLKGNVAAENGYAGLNGGDGCVASGNTASNNDQYGLIVGQGSTVIGNATRDNGITGITTGAGSTLAHNSSRSNGHFGIYTYCPSNVVGNTATDNTGSANLYFDGSTGGPCVKNFTVAP